MYIYCSGGDKLMAQWIVFFGPWIGSNSDPIFLNNETRALSWNTASRHLLTGTAGTGRAQPRRAVGRTGTGTGRRVGRERVEFFFKTVSYPFRIRVRLRYTGTTGTGTMGTGTRVFFLMFLFVVYVFFCCFYFTNIFFILQCRKIWIIYFRLSTNLNIHLKK
jgi:hypothetical protein